MFLFNAPEEIKSIIYSFLYYIFINPESLEPQASSLEDKYIIS